ncbi:U6 snRNP-associated protein Lsm7 [Gurleya vavrai]
MDEKSKIEKKQIIYELNRFKNKLVFCKLAGGKEIAGKLVSYDSLQNLVLCDPKKKEVGWYYGKYVIVIGNSISMMALGLPQKIPEIE